MLSEPYFEAIWYKTGLKKKIIVDQNLEGARACCASPCIRHYFKELHQLCGENVYSVIRRISPKWLQRLHVHGSEGIH